MKRKDYIGKGVNSRTVYKNGMVEESYDIIKKIENDSVIGKETKSEICKLSELDTTVDYGDFSTTYTLLS